MTRILSALVLLPIVLAAICDLPTGRRSSSGTIGAALAFVEYAAIAEKLGARVDRLVGGVATVATVAAFGWPGDPLDAVLLTALVTLGALSVATRASRRFDVDWSDRLGISDALHRSADWRHRRCGERLTQAPLLLLLAIVVVSDHGAYYTGRLLGRRPLAPAISPKKTREGAVGGLVGGSLISVILGRWWLPGAAPAACAALGLIVAAAGIVGDLFESQLKRSAGVKDSSTLIPGHGGVLDRIDSWLFAGPVFYVFVKATVL